MLLKFCQWLATTRGSIALHGSIVAYPIVESLHVLTLCLFIGFAMMLDLRLVGAILTKRPVSEVAGRLLPWMIAGFSVMVITGSLLFYAIPVKTYLNIFFRIKVALLILSGLNAYLFHAGIYTRVKEWDLAPVPPPRARIAGAVSLAFWASVIVAGRMIAYNWFDPSGFN